MDLLGGMSRDQLSMLPWVAGIVFALAAGVWRPRRLHWTALGSVLLFAALNAGLGTYVLNHFADPRWRAGGEAPLSAPSFSGTPVVGKFLGPLDAALNGVVGGVNEFLAFKQALPVALDFLAVAGWALLVAFPLGILAAGVNYAQARRRAATFDKYRATVDRLEVELEQLKLQLSPAQPVHAAPAPDTGATAVRPGPPRPSARPRI